MEMDCSHAQSHRNIIIIIGFRGLDKKEDRRVVVCRDRNVCVYRNVIWCCLLFHDVLAAPPHVAKGIKTIISRTLLLSLSRTTPRLEPTKYKILKY